MNHWVIYFFTHAANIWGPINWRRRPCSFHYPSLPSQDINLQLLGTGKPFVMLSEKNSTFWSVRRVGFKLVQITELWRACTTRMSAPGWAMGLELSASKQHVGSHCDGYAKAWRYHPQITHGGRGERTDLQFSYGWVMLCANSVLILGTQRSAAMALWSNKDMNMQTSIGHFHGKGKGNWGKWVAAVAWWSLGKHLKGGHIQAEVPASICPEDKMWKNSLGNAKNISNTKCLTK